MFLGLANTLASLTRAHLGCACAHFGLGGARLGYCTHLGLGGERFYIGHSSLEDCGPLPQVARRSDLARGGIRTDREFANCIPVNAKQLVYRLRQCGFRSHPRTHGSGSGWIVTPKLR